MAVGVVHRVRVGFTENLNLKLLSLACALLLYSVVHGSQDAQRSLLVSVVASTPQEPSKRELVTTIPSEIRVTISGLRSTLNELHADDLGSVSLDLRKADEERVIFEPSMIPLPPGLKVESIDPPAIDLSWEDRVTRDVPIEVGVVGSPAPGFVAESPVAEPDLIRVGGPKSQVNVIQRVHTDPFDVSGLKAGKYVQQLAVDRPSSRISYDTSTVSASVEIDREVQERSFARVPIAVVGRPTAKSQPGEADIRLACPPDVVRALRPEQIVPHVRTASTADHGSELSQIELTIDDCVVHATPPTVVVRW